MVVLAAYCLVVAHPGFVFKDSEEHFGPGKPVVEKSDSTPSGNFPTAADTV